MISKQQTNSLYEQNDIDQYIMKSYQDIVQKIVQQCEQIQRPVHSVQLLAVSKTQGVDKIRAMYQAGQRIFGENYLQEALQKIPLLTDLNIEWHFIGHVQRNKTKLLAEHFAWVQGVDRLLIAQRLSQQRPVHLPALNICLQVNIDSQDSKDGCHVDDVVSLVENISQLENIRLRGLMIIPAPHHTSAFADAKKLFDDVKAYHAHPKDWDTLSMGMSADYLSAIEQGATMVRVGTSLFGERVYLSK